MGICVIYFNEIMPQGSSDDRNFRPLQNGHKIPDNKITRAIMLLNMNLMENEHCMYEKFNPLI